MNARPLTLSVCIPTRNRPRELCQLLRCFESQEAAGVEVVISDNSDDDSTRHMLDESNLAIPGLKYIKQKSFVRFGENLLACVSEAGGDYLWLMGDDDLVVPGALSRILGDLSPEQDSYLLANFSAWNDDFSRMLIPSLFRHVIDERTPSGVGALRGIDLGVVTFLGAHIAPNRQDFRALLARHAGSNYPHVMAFAGLKIREIRTISDCLIQQRYQFSRSWDLMALYTVDYPDVFRALNGSGGFKWRFWNWKRSLVRKEVSRGVAGERVRGQRISWRQMAALARVYGTTPEFWLMVMPVLFLPQSILNQVKRQFGYFGKLQKS